MDLVNYKNKSGFVKNILILSFLIFLIISSATSVTASSLNAKKNIYIPAGTSFKGVLVNNFKCPTIFIKKQCHAKIKLTGPGSMPNKYELNLNGKCFVVSSGRAKLSTARFYSNMGTLICTDNGNRIRYKIRAYIVGKDSKVGIKGKLITKQVTTGKKNLIIYVKAGQHLTVTILKGQYIYLGK